MNFSRGTMRRRFIGSMFRKIAWLRVCVGIWLLNTRLGCAARRFEKLIGCGLGSVLNFIAQIALKFTAEI